MTTEERPGLALSPISASLFAATERLQEVIAAAPKVEPWYEEVRQALGACTRAVEYHLHSLDDDGGLKEGMSRDEPRLIWRLDRLDAELKHLLPELQDANHSAAPPSTALLGPLIHIAMGLRQVADEEVELLYESLIPIGSGD
jgi:hypothetical protein